MRKRSLIAAGLMILCVGLTACGGSKGTDNAQHSSRARIHPRVMCSLQMVLILQ